MQLLTTTAAAIAALTALSDAFDFQHPLQSLLNSHINTNQHQQQQPNIVFILTDDQDLRLDSLSYMPYVQKHLRDKGTFYENHFVPTALCCPARVTLWTGRYAHNTNVTNVQPPYGGFPKFVEQGFNSDFLPIWLQSAGYNTYYTGKLFNAHTVDNYHSPHVAGFNTSDFLLDPYTYSYLNSTYQRDKQEPVSYEGSHTSDVITNKALGLIDDGIAGANSGDKRPFFVGIAPVAPHSNLEPVDGPSRMTAPIPAKRHEHLFKDVKVPRTPHFNPDTPNGVNWISNLPQQSDETVDQNDHFYRQRLRALQAVDELVDQIVSRLEYTGNLDNTYIIYTSDNGYHIGQHRLPPGKECGFEEDIRVPLFIRGPGIPQGHVEKAVTAHVDLAPTVLHLAGAEQRDDFDGIPVPLLTEGKELSHEKTPISRRPEHANVEFWGLAIAEGEGNSFGPENPITVSNNTYKGLRLHSPESGYDLYYSVWCNNAHELYDLTTDPYQLHNIYPSASSQTRPTNLLLGVTIEQVINRLDALLLVLKSCRGQTCHAPWKVLHPEGNVETLKHALHWGFDSFYDEQVKIEYDRCEGGYIVSAEGPQVGYKYLTEREGLGWSHWE